MAKREDLWLRLVIHQSQHCHAKRRLHLCLGKQAIQDHLRVRVLFELDDDAHTVAVGFIADIGNTLEALVAHLVGHGGNELAFVDLIGKLGDDDALAVLAELLELGSGTDGDFTAAGRVGGADAASAHDDTARREIGALNVLHEVEQICLRIFQNADACVDDLAEVVRRNIRRHADGNTGRTVDKKVREPGREHTRLFSRLVEVRVPIDGVFIDVAQHLVAELRHARLGVTVGRGGIAIDRAEVAVAVDQHVTHGKVLRKADHCVVDGSVAVRMVPAKDVADAGRRFFEGLVRSQAIFVHGVQNTPVNRLEAIAHVGKRSSDDDRHCVVNVRRLHLLHELGLYNRLFGEHDVLGLVIFLMCHRLVSLCWRTKFDQ